MNGRDPWWNSGASHMNRRVRRRTHSYESPQFRAFVRSRVGDNSGPLCRTTSASAISAVNKTLDESLDKFAKRRLEESYPYLVLDARYEKTREDGVIRSRAVQIAIGINEGGRRQILAVELANRESESSWRDFLLGLKERGLYGVEFVVSDDHPGLKRAIWEVLPEAVWQRCYVHLLRNALDHLPRKANDDCLQELRWIYDRRDLSEAQKDLTQWLAEKIAEVMRMGRGKHWRNI